MMSKISNQRCRTRTDRAADGSTQRLDLRWQARVYAASRAEIQMD